MLSTNNKQSKLGQVEAIVLSLVELALVDEDEAGIAADRW